jgi:hypothetical protein
MADQILGVIGKKSAPTPWEKPWESDIQAFHIADHAEMRNNSEQDMIHSLCLKHCSVTLHSYDQVPYTTILPSTQRLRECTQALLYTIHPTPFTHNISGTYTRQQ